MRGLYNNDGFTVGALCLFPHNGCWDFQLSLALRANEFDLRIGIRHKLALVLFDIFVATSSKVLLDLVFRVLFR